MVQPGSDVSALSKLHTRTYTPELAFAILLPGKVFLVASGSGKRESPGSRMKMGSRRCPVREGDLG